MKKEEFIEVLKRNNYLYEIQGDKIIVTHDGYVDLGFLETIPPGVEFRNNGRVDLRSLETLPPGVEFKNRGNVWLDSLENLSPGAEFKNGGDVYLRGILGVWLDDWEGNIEGVGGKRLLSLMSNKELFL